jgi:exonuclease SbcC
MRVHSLRVRGIGPFADEQAIDFDELSQQGLFLLDGPTGVGKSTIVDAIVFALFGSPATDDGQDRMVSDFLGHDIAKADRPFVELTFSTAEGTFRIHREPKAPYVNRNGKAGLHNASVRLTRLSNEAADDGTLVSTSAPEVGAEVSRLLGLNRDQVLSTIVLAQGQFARFLKARTEDRRAILQSVFNTQRYEQLQNALVDARKSAYVRREGVRRQLSEAIAAFVEAARVEMEAQGFAAEYASDPQAAQGALDAHVDALVAQAEDYERQVHESAATERAAAAALQSGRQQAQLVAEKNELLAKRAALLTDQARIQALSEAVDQAHAAALVHASEMPVREREQELQLAQARLDAFLHDLPQSKRHLAADALDEHVTGLAQQQAALGDVLALEAGLSIRRARCDDMAADVARLQVSVAQQQERLASVPQAIEQARRARDELAARAAHLPVDAKELAEAAAAEDLLLRVDALRDAVAAAREQQSQAVELAHVAEEALVAARNRYRNGLAAELAATLRDGADCPVCGSADHPRPARLDVGHVTAERMDELDTEWRQLNRTVQLATSSLNGLLAELHSQEVLLQWTDHEEVQLARKRAAERVELGEAAQRELPHASTLLNGLETELQQRRETCANDRERLAGLEQGLRLLVQQFERDAQRIDEARQGFESVAARDRELAATRHLVEQAAGARRVTEKIHHSLVDARAAYEHALALSPFVNEDAYAVARRSPEWVTASQADVERHTRELHAVGQRLASDALAGLDPATTVDVNGLEEIARVAKEASDRAVAAFATAQETAQRSHAANARVKAAWLDCEHVERTTEPIIRLANLASGQHPNLHGVKLATYVVKRRFAEVVDAANTHLATMSDGRYRLQTTDGPSGAERTYGLGIDVFDDRTDAPRSPSTLSGGETFYVSLSLALGLADVVQSEAGGLSIDTLFIDEGFGSLDADTLDTVMEVLTSLSRGHRTVGLISHVEEMKRRIPDRVEIHRPDPNGPSQVKARL